MRFPETRLTFIERLASGGSEEGWRDFLQDYWGPVCRFALRWGAPSLADAEEPDGDGFLADQRREFSAHYMELVSGSAWFRTGPRREELAMFFPIPREMKTAVPAHTKAPAAHALLIFINVLIYVCGGFWPVGPGTGLLTVVLYGFTHFSFWHLVMNMWALCVFGNPLNRRLFPGRHAGSQPAGRRAEAAIAHGGGGTAGEGPGTRAPRRQAHRSTWARSARFVVLEVPCFDRTRQLQYVCGECSRQSKGRPSDAN
jgi:hypothetical protein